MSTNCHSINLSSNEKIGCQDLIFNIVWLVPFFLVCFNIQSSILERFRALPYTYMPLILFRLGASLYFLFRFMFLSSILKRFRSGCYIFWLKRNFEKRRVKKDWNTSIAACRRSMEEPFLPFIVYSNEEVYIKHSGA